VLEGERREMGVVHPWHDLVVRDAQATRRLASSGSQESSETRGLYDGFEGYRTPTQEDYRRLLNEGLVVPDANVLLNLYRYHSQTQTDLLQVLEKLGDRLFVPHQVLVEFWHNRESALRDRQDTAESTIEALKHQSEQTIAALRAWANRIALAPEKLAELEGELQKGFGALTDAITELTEADEVERSPNTNTDPVLARLETILTGRVGAPPKPEAKEAAVKEALRRIEAEEPPGYKDKNKDDDSAVGDYLVWTEVLHEAEQRSAEVLLVTGDVKDDWWRRERGETRGPRLELVTEMKKRAGVELFMLRPESLLRHAAAVLQIDVREESVRDVERVERFLAGLSGGCTVESVRTFMERLSQEAVVQAEAVRLAAKKGGFVSREDVYQLGGYEEGRTLRGFTRPARRIAHDLREQGVLQEGSAEILEAVYEGDVQAAGFRIPADLIPLIRDLSTEPSPADSGSVVQRQP